MSTVRCCDHCGELLYKRKYPLIDRKIHTNVDNNIGYILLSAPLVGRDSCKQCMVENLRELADRIDKWEGR